MTDGLDPAHALAAVVILAGGASSRMGSPKAKLILPTGETLLDYHVRQASKLNVPIMIADNGRGFTVAAESLSNGSELRISHIADDDSLTNPHDNHDEKGKGKEKETSGALVAILSALQSMTNLADGNTPDNKHAAWLLVISCDSLIPASDLWQKLHAFIDQVLDKSVICLTDELHLYPLLGLYCLSIESDLRAYLDGGERQVMRFIKPKVQAIPLSKNWQHLTNFNTPIDFRQACTALNDV